MKDRLQKIRNEAIAQIKAAGGMDALNDICLLYTSVVDNLTFVTSIIPYIYLQIQPERCFNK